MKWKTLPEPTALSTQMRPPMSSTSRAQMARPRPVPPKRCCVDVVGLGVALEDRDALVLGDADAVVADAEVEPRRVSAPLACALAPVALDLDRDLALVGELHRVRHQVEDHLPQPRQIAHHDVGDLRIDPQQQIDLLAPRLDREHLDGVADRLAQLERRGDQLELAGLGLRQIEHVVQQQEQRFGRLADRSGAGSRSGSPSAVSSASSAMPMMPFIGVRISWLMTARNSALARAAASASSLAKKSSWSRSRLRVTSCATA